MSELGDRILAALQKNPALMWEVAHRIRVLGPWEAWPQTGGPAAVRKDSRGCVGAAVRSILTDGVLGWSLNYQTAHHHMSVPLTPTSTTAADLQAVLAEADECLRIDGFTLLAGDLDVL